MLSANRENQEEEKTEATLHIETLLTQLQPENVPLEVDCIRMMGYAHLGAVLMPTIEDDSYEQPQMNFYPGIKKMGNTQNSEHSEVRMLIFGGSKWRDREPN